MNNVEIDQALGLISIKLDNADYAQRELAEAVQEAREVGASWTLIGRVLGITKQAAQQRFGR